MSEQGQNTRVAVIGAGSWGTALANLLAAKGHDITLWARDWRLVQRMRHDGENAAYLTGVPLHPRITPSADLTEAVSATAIFVSVVPSHAVRPVWERLAARLPASALVVSATKGIEAGSLWTMSQVLQATLAPRQEIDIAVLSGPTFAREVSHGTPTAAVAAASSRAVAELRRAIRPRISELKARAAEALLSLSWIGFHPPSLAGRKELGYYWILPHDLWLQRGHVPGPLRARGPLLRRSLRAHLRRSLPRRGCRHGAGRLHRTGPGTGDGIVWRRRL